jgi:hypothetical protein
MIGYQDIRKSGSRSSGNQDIRLRNIDKFPPGILITWCPAT